MADMTLEEALRVADKRREIGWMLQHEDVLVAEVRKHQWMPIESAPRDGSWFVIYRIGEADSYEVGRYSPLSGDKYEHVSDDLYRLTKRVLYEWDGFNNFHRATHWMPLPAPPKEEA